MDNKEKIQWKAYELFKRFGVRSVTMDEIAQQCGVSKKTVYQFYEDKDTLVEQIVQTLTNRSEDYCSKQQVVADNAIEEIFLSIDMVEEMIEGVNPALLNDLRKYHTAAYSKLEKHKKEFMSEFFRKNIERGIEEGLYRNDFKTDIITAFYLHSSMVAIEQDIFPKKYSIADINYEISMFILHGLATPKGAKLVEKYKLQRLKLNTL
jgi:AcrR family transcriptional regulator